MIEALLEGLVLVLQWKALAFMLLGILLGFWVGLLPGLGGATTLALMRGTVSSLIADQLAATSSMVGSVSVWR